MNSFGVMVWATSARGLRIGWRRGFRRVSAAMTKLLNLTHITASRRGQKSFGDFHRPAAICRILGVGEAMADIFIAYARQDRARARTLAEALEQKGFSVWWDDQMRTGQRFRNVIVEELGNANCIVVLWSKTSTESDWVLDEAERGKERGVLVPVSLDGVKPPLGFGGIQTTDLAHWPHNVSQSKFGQLIAHISGASGHAQKNARGPESPGSETLPIDPNSTGALPHPVGCAAHDDRWRGPHEVSSGWSCLPRWRRTVVP